LGKEASHWRSSSFETKRAADTGRPKKAFSIDESPLGGKKENWRNTKSLYAKERHTYSCRSKEAFGADEGPLGSETEIRRKIAAGSRLGPSDCRPVVED
jgi:hypothetical protein